jgi:hypothetical protein
MDVSCRSKELGCCGLPENVEYLREEAVLLTGFRPSSNLAEVANATFWVRAGGAKGPYLTRADALMEEGSNAILQIVRRRAFEQTGLRERGPSEEEAKARSGRRQEAVEKGRAKRRLSLGDISEQVARAGLTTDVIGGEELVSKTVEIGARGGEAGLGEKSAHRFDRQRVDVQRSGGKTKEREGGREKGVLEKERMVLFEKLAMGLADGSIQKRELTRDEYAGVMALQKEIEKGKCREAEAISKEDSQSGSVGVVMDETDRDHVIENFGEEFQSRGSREGEKLGEGGMEERESSENRKEQGNSGGREGRGTSGQGQTQGPRGGREEAGPSGNREEGGERGQRPEQGGEGERRDQGGSSQRQERETFGERGGGEEGRQKELVPLDGEERYAETEWGIARLRKSYESACVGVAGASGRCGVLDFKKERAGSSPGVLVLHK